MPTFTYTARDSSGKKIEGEVTAATSSEAARQLRDEGKIVLSVASAKAGRLPGRIIPPSPGLPGAATPASSGLFAPRLNADDVRVFANQLAVMLGTGVSLSDALEACTDSRNSPGFAQALDDVIAQVRSGISFSAALARNPRVFSPLFVNMVKASEASGQLGPMLRRVADFLAGQRELGRKIKGAVTYPIVMTLLAIGVIIFMVTFVLPKFAKIYAGKEDTLPIITRFLMSGSTWIVAYGLYAAGGLVIVIVATIVYLRRPGGRLILHRFKLRLPLFGGLFHKTYLARSLRTLGTLIQAGVSMLEAVELTGGSVSNVVYEEFWSSVHDRLQTGRQLSESVSESRLVPRSVVKMLHAGEHGGRLGDVLDRVATHCEEEVAAKLKAVTTLIEPAIIIFVGSMVGGIVLSLLLPIFTISKAMRPGH